MNLRQIRPSYNTLTDDERILLIQATNERRLKAYEVKIKSRGSSTGRKKSTSTRKKKAPMTKEQLKELILSMTPAERAKFIKANL